MVAKKVGILTGGGDVPGLNVAIRTLVHCMQDAGWSALGLKRGWASLLEILPDGSNREQWTVPLDKANARKIDRTGGTVLHTSRTNPMAVAPDAVPAHLIDRVGPLPESGTYDLTGVAVATIEALELDALVAIGGDDTLSFAARLDQEGVSVVGLPKTMDNDVFGTDYCIGFSTAISRSVNMITDLRSAAGSHERHLVVELFGRNSGETSLMIALLAMVDRALISEVPFDPERLVTLLVADREANPSRYSVLTVSEGAYPAGGAPLESGEADAFGHRKLGGIGARVGEYIKRISGHGLLYQNLAYLMRSGPPDSLDRLVAINFARSAAELILKGRTGQMLAVEDGKYRTQPMRVVSEGVRRVNVDRYYDIEQYRPKLDDVLGKPMFLE